MRPIQLMEKPIAPPGICIKCGSDHKGRDWFIDLGINQEANVGGHWIDSVLYLCNRCVEDLLIQYTKQLPRFIENQRNIKAANAKNDEDLVVNLRHEIDHLLGRIRDKDAEIAKLREVKEDQELTVAKSALDSLDASILKTSKVPVDFDKLEDNDTRADNSDATPDVDESDADNSGTDGNSETSPSPIQLGSIQLT